MREGLRKAGAKRSADHESRSCHSEEYTGGIIGDLTSRRGMVQGKTPRQRSIITAMVPLANMFGYINNLRSMSSGSCKLLDVLRPL